MRICFKSFGHYLLKVCREHSGIRSMIHQMFEAFCSDILTVRLPKRCNEYNTGLIEYFNMVPPTRRISCEPCVNIHQAIDVSTVIIKSLSRLTGHDTSNPPELTLQITILSPRSGTVKLVVHRVARWLRDEAAACPQLALKSDESDGNDGSHQRPEATVNSLLLWDVRA
jgi:hypothetical protein